MAKFWFLYARPGQRVLLYRNGEMVVSPTPLDIRLQGFKRSKLRMSVVLTVFPAHTFRDCLGPKQTAAYGMAGCNPMRLGAMPAALWDLNLVPVAGSHPVTVLQR